MRRFVIYFFSIFLLFQSSLVAYSSNPKDFINELVTDALSQLSDNTLTNNEKKLYIEKIALENVGR